MVILSGSSSPYAGELVEYDGVREAKKNGTYNAIGETRCRGYLTRSDHFAFVPRHSDDLCGHLGEVAVVEKGSRSILTSLLLPAIHMY